MLILLILSMSPGQRLATWPRNSLNVSFDKRVGLQVDLVDNLEVAGQQLFEQTDVPLLERFREDGMAG